MKNAITSYYEVPQCADKDPDALVPPVTDGSQLEVEVKPVPSPRPRLQHKSLWNISNNTADSVDTTSNTTKAVRPPPTCPPRPPMSQCATSSKPTAADGNLYVKLNTVKATDRTDRPAVLPRPRPSSLPLSTSVCETSPPQTRPPPPQFNLPPPPAMGSPSEPLYIEMPTYLEILPADKDEVSGCSTSHQQTTEDTEDINGMLTWLKRVSKSNFTVPSLYGLSIGEEMRSFSQRAMNVRKALQIYNLLMVKRNGGLRDIIAEFISISDGLDKMKKMNKNMGIAGGTTGAVGGVTAMVGIAFAPITLGASLIATAIGAGMVASAGGIGAHTAIANKKTVDRKTIEKLVGEYNANIIDVEHCLDFILSGMNELRRHNILRLLRAGAPPDALKMAHLSQSVFGMNQDTSHAGGVSSEKLIQAFAKEMDLCFSEKDGQKLKKSNKSRFSGRVRLLAENLQDELDHLIQMCEMFG
ncbi:uncharacterized protein LOC123985898 isoform X1 [Micropterus dolomieu]|uniref:uncharacterized protein LOC123985898 isoform X1 n=2 Tax=Micropterus dolomieu TaxID=147949 RepID=UPI001E8CCBBF|nr:uncharacterized protein LOC123985898 isoform X1 [Micropterus dolomieu]XP_045929836.1 uncharacterized protein LOC123985898 isoform X1 [Micropterus dolomieu]